MKGNCEVTILSKDDIINNSPFGISNTGTYNRKNLMCRVSDFAGLMGCYVERIKDANYCNWGTFSLEEMRPVCIDPFGSFENVTDIDSSFIIGVRPVLLFANEEEYNMIREQINQNLCIRDNLMIFEYGSYPQSVVSSDLNEELESKFKMGNLEATGNIYTTFDERIVGLDYPVIEKNIEYKYNDKIYVRLCENSFWEYYQLKLSNGEWVTGEKPYWIEVNPINWIVDDKNMRLISETVLISGIKFYSEDNIDDFKNTTLYKFLNYTFFEEILQFQDNKLFYGKDRNENEINPYGLNFNEVSEEDIIKGSLDSGLSVFLHGQSSEGKSSRVKAIDPDCEIIYLGSTTLDMFVGKSVYNANTGKADVIKPYWLERLEEKCEKEPERIHIVFLDELTNAFPSVQSYAYNLVLDKKLNGMWQLPENARIVAAGNDMEDSIAAHQMPEPLFNRFVHVYIKTSVPSWLKWASDNNIHPAIYGFIAYKKDESLRTKYDGVKPNADPRKWEMASKMLYATGSPEMLRGLVGEDVTREFIQFCKQNIITLNDVINDNYSDREINALNVSEKYATTMNLTQVDEKNLEKVRNFTKRLGEEFCSLFESMWIHNDDARLELIAEARLADNLELERGTMR